MSQRHHALYAHVGNFFSSHVVPCLCPTQHEVDGLNLHLVHTTMRHLGHQQQQQQQQDNDENGPVDMDELHDELRAGGGAGGAAAGGVGGGGDDDMVVEQEGLLEGTLITNHLHDDGISTLGGDYDCDVDTLDDKSNDFYSPPPPPPQNSTISDPAVLDEAEQGFATPNRTPANVLNRSRSGSAATDSAKSPISTVPTVATSRPNSASSTSQSFSPGGPTKTTMMRHNSHAGAPPGMPIFRKTIQQLGVSDDDCEMASMDDTSIGNRSSSGGGVWWCYSKILIAVLACMATAVLAAVILLIVTATTS